MLFKDVYYLGEDFEARRGDVAVRGDTIEYVGPAAPAEDFGEIISGGSRLVLPGFVNAHCHAPMTLLRGWGEGLPLDRWLTERVFPFEGRLTAEDVYWGSLLGIAEMLASGVTSFSDMYSFCGSVCEAARLSGIKANVSRGLLSQDGGALRESKAFYETEELFNTWDGACGGRIKAEASIHAEYTSHESFVRELAEYAKACGAGIHIHLSETRREHGECIARRGATPAEYFERCGVFEARATAAHCVHITDADIEILARNGVFPAHCPTSNLKLGSGVAPVPKMLSAGINTALGTDGASSNNNLNMLEEIHLSALIHRGAAEDSSLTPPGEVLKMASLNGARAQGRGDTGVIKPGFKADLAVLKLDSPRLTPLHDVLSGAVFAAQGSDIEMTIVDGKILYAGGEFTSFDIREAAKKAAAAAGRIANELLG